MKLDKAHKCELLLKLIHLSLPSFDTATSSKRRPAPKLFPACLAIAVILQASEFQLTDPAF